MRRQVDNHYYRPFISHLQRKSKLKLFFQPGKKFENTPGVIRSRRSHIASNGNRYQFAVNKRSLKLPMGKSEQYDGQKNMIKRINNDLQTLHRKLKIEQHEPHYKPGINSGRVSSSCFTCDTRRVILPTIYLQQRQILPRCCVNETAILIFNLSVPYMLNTG